MQYVVFLRGINLGKRQVSMKDLQDVLASHGFSTVRTFIASGNVLLESAETNEKKLQKDLEEILEKRFQFVIPVILRSMEDMQKLIDSKPSENMSSSSYASDKEEIASSQTLRNEGMKMRLQITFFSDEVPYFDDIKKEGFLIRHIDARTLASVVYPEGKTTDLMTFIDKTFGKNSTTRNWNTILKVVR